MYTWAFYKILTLQIYSISNKADFNNRRDRTRLLIIMLRESETADYNIERERNS